MLKYFKEYLSDYQHSDWLQTTILIASILFFAGLVYVIMSRPKNYYKEESEMPLQDDDSFFQNSN